MDFNKDAIQRQVSTFWRKNWKQFCFKLNGKELKPESVSSITPQLEEGDFGNGYNFSCLGLNLRVSINGIEKPYKAEFVIKVVPIFKNDNSKPSEIITGIQNNTITLRD